jgi:hypothetical protein
MEKIGKDLNLGDTLYYVDDTRFEIREYVIEGMKLSLGNIQQVYSTPYGSKPPKQLWNGITISFGEQWEKTPTILKDGKGGRNQWNDFEIFIYKEDAQEILNREIDKEIKRKQKEIEKLLLKRI